jgi:hypothetical protein
VHGISETLQTLLPSPVLPFRSETTTKNYQATDQEKALGSHPPSDETDSNELARDGFSREKVAR